MIKAFKILCLVFPLLFLQNTIAQNPSTLYQNWVDAQVNNTTPILPTFSYAGYKNGEFSLPNQLTGQIYDITNYGAVADDTISDKQAIIDAIAAAEANPNGGVIFFPSGRFIINDSTADDVTELITITKSNIVLKGNGSGVGGTELYQKDFVPHPDQATKPFVNPYLIEFTNGKSFTKPKITDVTGNAARETYTVQVASTANISVGQWVELYVKSTNANFLSEELAPFSTSDFFEPQNLNIVNNGVTISELHKVVSTTANSITFKEPIHRAVNATYGWEIRKYTPIENVGIQDLKYTGGYVWDFIHHKAPKALYPNEPEATDFAFLSDAAWSGIRLRQVVNGWIRNIEFSNVSRGALFSSSANCTALDNRYVGNPGHTFISASTSTGCFIGKSIDTSSGVWHGSGVTGQSIGNVLWKNEHPANGNSGMELHANQPRSNLFDACKGGFFFNQGGATQSLPNHLKNMVLWNFEGVSYQNTNVKSFRPNSETRFAKFIMPIISGLKGFTMSSSTNQFQENESPGTHVDEASLYEKQLEYRLGSVPDWINNNQIITKIVHAQDFEFENATNGFEVKIVSDGGFPNPSTEIVKRQSGTNLPAAANSNNLFVTQDDRQSETIPEGQTADHRSVRIRGTDSGTNYPINTFVVFNTLDLSTANPLIDETDVFKYVSFWNRRDFNTGDVANISLKVSTNYNPTTGNVSTATWTNLPVISGTFENTGDKRTYYKVIADLTSYANGSSGNTVTVAVQFIGNGDNTGSVRNGTFTIADMQFFTRNVKLVDEWNGKESSSYFNAANWKNKAAPTSTTNDIYIPNNATNYPSISNLLTANKITIASGASFIADATVNATIIYKRFLTTPEATGNSTVDNLEGWHLVAAPVAGESFGTVWANDNGIATGSNGNRAIATYNNANNINNKWEYSNGSVTNFITGKGYSVKRTFNGDISFEGSMNTSNISNVSISSGFNLVGNPFTAFLNNATFLNLASNDNVLDSKSIWIWNPTTKNYEVKLSGDDPSFQIAPGQGFFVKAASAGNLIFNTNTRSHQTNDTFAKNNSNPKITLNVTSNAIKRFTKIRYIDSATNGFDNGFDGETFTGTHQKLDVFSELIENTTNKKYQIQAVANADYNNKIFPIGVLSSSKREIIFSVDVHNIPDGYNVYLEDRVHNTFTNLSAANSVYKTMVNAQETVGQFYLHLKEASVLHTASNLLSSIKIYTDNNATLKITGLTGDATKVSIYSILGKTIKTIKFDGKASISINLPKLASGIYLVKLNTSKGEINKKIIIE